MKRQGKGPLIPPARAADAMDQSDCLLSDQAGPDLMVEDRFDLGLVRKGMKQRLGETEPDVTAFIDKLEGGDVHVVSPNLAISDHPVAGKLKSRYTKL